jgi:hypothetical protein
MGKRADFRANRVKAEGPWVAHSAELISSPAWRARSIHVVRLLDRLELEHCNHGGSQNGYLTVTYDQFVEWALGRRFIKRAIEEALQLRLLIAYPGLYRGGNRRNPSRYQLTYLKSKFVPTTGAPYFREPTHGWRKIESKPKYRKSNRMVTTGESSKCTTGELKRSRLGCRTPRML